MDQSPCRGIGRQKTATVIFNRECPKVVDRFRFLHTCDWQLGMTKHFFSEVVQERFVQSRFDAIRELGRIAKEEDCQFRTEGNILK